MAARAAADAAFTPAALDRQRQSIMERIGKLGAAARVLPFPAGPAATSRPAVPAADRRWVLAAAAAGIILGIGVGRLPSGPDTSCRRPERPWLRASPRSSRRPIRAGTIAC